LPGLQQPAPFYGVCWKTDQNLSGNQKEQRVADEVWGKSEVKERKEQDDNKVKMPKV
jgi:hypothetical protein